MAVFISPQMGHKIEDEFTDIVEVVGHHLG